MTTIEARKLIESVKPNTNLPPIKRNKSWLFIFGEASGELHFYDVKFEPGAAFDRIIDAHEKKDRATELLDLLAYTTPDEAADNAKLLRDAQTTINYYRKLISVRGAIPAIAAAGAAAPATVHPDATAAATAANPPTVSTP